MNKNTCVSLLSIAMLSIGFAGAMENNNNYNNQENLELEKLSQEFESRLNLNNITNQEVKTELSKVKQNILDSVEYKISAIDAKKKQANYVAKIVYLIYLTNLCLNDIELMDKTELKDAFSHMKKPRFINATMDSLALQANVTFRRNEMVLSTPEAKKTLRAFESYTKLFSTLHGEKKSYNTTINPKLIKAIGFINKHLSPSKNNLKLTASLTRTLLDRSENKQMITVEKYTNNYKTQAMQIKKEFKRLYLKELDGPLGTENNLFINAKQRLTEVLKYMLSNEFMDEIVNLRENSMHAANQISQIQSSRSISAATCNNNNCTPINKCGNCKNKN